MHRQACVDGRWDSASEARLAVLYHVMGRGMCLAEVGELMTGRGMWSRGLGRAFSRYKYDQAIAKALKKIGTRLFTVMFSGVVVSTLVHTRHCTQGYLPTHPRMPYG